MLVSWSLRGEMGAQMAEKSSGARPARSKKADGRAEVLALIAAMPDADREMAERFHAIIERVAPSLTPRTWYGMPAYAKDGKVLCFFQAASKFKARYATFGFEEIAALDDGTMWPTAFALIALGDVEEKRIEELVRKAMG